MPLWTTVYVALFWVLLAVLLAACLRWGDRPTRLACGSFAVCMVVQKLARLGVTATYHLLSIPALLIDLALLAILAAIALRHPRWWAIALAAVQLVTCLGHLSKLLFPHISRLTYALLIGSGGYPAIILLSAGLIASIRNRAIPADRPA